MALRTDEWGNYTFDDGRGWFNPAGVHVDTQTGQPDGGAPDRGGGGGRNWWDTNADSVQTVTIDGPQGYGLYKLDGPGQTAGTFLGSTVRPSTGGGAQVNVSTGGHNYQTMAGDQGYGTYDVSVYPPQFVGAKATPAVASNFNDTNGDGFDDQTGLPNGAARIGSDLYYHGIRINPDGSPMTPDQIAAAGGGSKPTWTGYGPKGQGTYYLDGPGGTAGTYLGPTTAAGAGISSGGGSSGGGGSASSSVHSGGYDNTTTTVHEGGYTNQTLADPAQLAATAQEKALDRAMQASQFAYTSGLNAGQAKIAASKAYGDALRDYDPQTFQLWLEATGGGRLDNAILGGGNGLSANAVAPAATALDALRGLQANGQGWDPSAWMGGGTSGGLQSGEQMTTSGGGLQLTGGSTGAGATGSAGAVGNTSPAAPAANGRTADGGFMRNGVDVANHGPMPQIDYMGNSADGSIINGDPRGAFWYSDAGQSALGVTRPGYDPYAGLAQPRNAPAQMTTSGGGLQLKPAGPLATIAADPYVNPAGNLQNDQIVNGVRVMARGGIAGGPTIMGDSESGRPTGHEEMAMVPPGTPIFNHDQTLAMMGGEGGLRRALAELPADGTMVGGLRRAYIGAQGQWIQEPINGGEMAPSLNEAPTWFSAPVAPPVAKPPVVAPRPVAAAPAPAAPAPAPVAAPPPPSSQIGNYSTAPGTAGQPVPPPVAPAPAVAPPAASLGTAPLPTPVGGLASQQPGGLPGLTPTSDLGDPTFNEVLNSRLQAQNPWMNTPDAFMSADYESRDPIARRSYEQWLQLRYGIPPESIAFAIARNRLAGASAASMSQGR